MCVHNARKNYTSSKGRILFESFHDRAAACVIRVHDVFLALMLILNDIYKRIKE